jgi:hypothetical protein
MKAGLLRAAAGDLVLNPFLLLSGQISSASHALAIYFDGIDSSLDDGSSLAKAVTGDDISRVMKRMIHSSRLTGFQHAAQHTKRPMPALYGRKIQQAAARRADKVNSLMVGSTKSWLESTPDSDYVLGSDRALRAARFEASRAYYRGVMDAMGGSGFQKAWNTTSEEPCDFCNENEDQGYIDVDEPFSSGDFYPLAHLNCQCYLTARKPQWVRVDDRQRSVF